MSDIVAHVHCDDHLPGEEEEWPRLHLAIVRGEAQKVQQILDDGANFENPIKSKDRWINGGRALHLAVREGDFEIVSELLNRGAFFDAMTPIRITPLFVALHFRHRRIALELLKRGANGRISLLDTVPEFGGFTPLHLAAASGDQEMLRVLLDDGVHKDAVTYSGMTPLLVAIAANHVETARELLRRGANYGRVIRNNVLVNNRANALHFAVEHGLLELVEDLLDISIDIDGRTACGWTPLVYAIVKGHTTVAKRLIEHGATCDLKPKYLGEMNDNKTLLHMAAERGLAEVVEMMLDQGVSYAVRDVHGNTPLHVASKVDVAVVNVLLAKGRRYGLDQENRDGETPLQIAEHWGKKEIKQALTRACGNHSMANSLMNRIDTQAESRADGLSNPAFHQQQTAARSTTPSNAAKDIRSHDLKETFNDAEEDLNGNSSTSPQTPSNEGLKQSRLNELKDLESNLKSMTMDTIVNERYRLTEQTISCAKFVKNARDSYTLDDVILEFYPSSESMWQARDIHRELKGTGCVCKMFNAVDWTIPFIVIEPSGLSLQDWMRIHHNHFSKKAAIVEILEAIRRMHSHNIVHGDLRPSNILYSPSLFKWTLVNLKSAFYKGRSSSIRTRKEYASPELISAATGRASVQLDTAMDVWSFGIIMYEVVSESQFYNQDAEALRMTDALRSEHVSQCMEKVDIKDYRQIIQQTLQTNPAARPSAEWLVRSLEAL